MQKPKNRPTVVYLNPFDLPDDPQSPKRKQPNKQGNLKSKSRLPAYAFKVNGGLPDNLMRIMLHSSSERSSRRPFVDPTLEPKVLSTTS